MNQEASTRHSRLPAASEPDKLKCPKFIVLGAGRPFQGEEPTALTDNWLGYGRVLDWTLATARCLSAEIHFVGGYRIDEIARRYPEVSFSVNPDWEQTGAVFSLLSGRLDGDREHYISYSDILFRDSILLSMANQSADIAVVVDTHWRNRFAGRTAKDMMRCEKVNLDHGMVTGLGPNIDPGSADAEFIGLVRLLPRVVRHLVEDADALRQLLHKSHMSELIELLRVRGFSVAAVDARGEWAEMNESQDIARFVLGTKAETLQRLERLLRHGRIEDQISFVVAEWREAAETILTRITDRFAQRRLVVRSSTLSEDGFASANAGAYASVLDIEGGNRNAIRRAIDEVVSSYGDANLFHQVLVQAMLEDVRASGVVVTRTLSGGAPYYFVNYDESGSTASITRGSSDNHKTLVVYRDVADAEVSFPSPLQNLFPAIREIESLLNFDALDIEFAITGDEIVHILQVRPIAVQWRRHKVSDADVAAALSQAREHFTALRTPRPSLLGDRPCFGLMPDWNPAEIIGPRPSRLAFDLYRFLIMDDVWATQRAEYGYRDVRPQPLLWSFAGHAYVDVRASFNSFVPAGLDNGLSLRLVNFYLDWLAQHPHLHDKIEFEVVPTCYELNFTRWEQRLRQDGGFVAEEIQQLQHRLKQITLAGIARTASDLARVQQFKERFAAVAAPSIPPLQRATTLLEDCRRHGTLVFAHLARSAFIAVRLLKSAVESGVIRQEAMEAFLKSIRTVTHAFTEDAAATARGDLSWDAFIEQYGHLRPGTYDITSPCYRDDPERFLRPIVDRASKPPPDTTNDKEWQAAREAFGSALNAAGLPVEVAEFERFARSAIEGRELSKFVFTRHLSSAIDLLAGVGASLGIDRAQLANLPLASLLALRDGSLTTHDAGPLHTIANEGGRVREIGRLVELPPLLLDEQDFVYFEYPNTEPNFIGNRRVVAECVDLEKADQKALDLTGRIVLVPQADPGYDWLFGRGIAGLITSYGGANSHMAIRAAEFGLPAAIGVGEAQYRRLARASVLDLDAASRRIQVFGE
jgi:choline kinase